MPRQLHPNTKAHISCIKMFIQKIYLCDRKIKVSCRNTVNVTLKHLHSTVAYVITDLDLEGQVVFY